MRENKRFTPSAKSYMGSSDYQRSWIRDKATEITQTPPHSIIHPKHESNIELLQIIKVHYPSYRTMLPASSNFEDLLNNFLKDIKSQNNKTTNQLSEKIKQLEKEKQILKVDNQFQSSKVATLNAEIKGLIEKYKKSEQKCYQRNQQLFRLKEEVERKAKEKVMTASNNIAASQLDLFKQNAYAHLNKYKLQLNKEKEKTKNTLAENKHLKNQIQFLNKRVRDYESDFRQMNELIGQLKRQKEDLEEEKTNVEFTLSRINDREDFRQKTQRMLTRDMLSPSSGRSMSKPKFNFDKSRSKLLNPPEVQKLIEENEQLKKSQSTLLDKLMEKDEQIQKMELTIKNCLILPDESNEDLAEEQADEIYPNQVLAGSRFA